MRKRTSAYSYLSYTERLQIETMYKHKIPVKIIAAEIGKHISTIYRELKRGKCILLDKEYRYYTSYSCDVAHGRYRNHMQAKGAPLKIGNDHVFANYLEKRILYDGLSPDAVLGEIARKKLPFRTKISTRTFYSYIKKGLFHLLTEEALLYKGKRNKPLQKRRAASPPRGTSIEKRPLEINERIHFGHWEMDTVYGPKGGTKNTLLVFTERKHRFELVLPIPDRTARSVEKSINAIERKLGRSFQRVFRSITIDNGSEFAHSKKLERSPYTKKQRTKLYYCHPYNSGERGSNENANGIIRRYIPKGIDLSKYSKRDLASIQNKINTMPRKILHYATAWELFEEELRAIDPSLCKLSLFNAD